MLVVTGTVLDAFQSQSACVWRAELPSSIPGDDVRSRGIVWEELLAVYESMIVIMDVPGFA